eukprot:TRINITY_DN15708_c0_g1_i1.p1 TRINITY_DN15708_c0_g1~~TRINITY_DN15708_c0_g1_i1.p1  ORF type:complete len:312 (+),score=17.08 TRINITY_DN15708_c0_g1_i1:54-989(+)
MSGFFGPIRHACSQASVRCQELFPCLSDPVRRSSLGLKFTLVVLHVVFAGVLFILDGWLVEKTRKHPWYTAIYLLLFVTTLVQYFFTSSSSPGYVLDALRVANETHAIFRKTSGSSKQSASSKNGNPNTHMDDHQVGTWLKRVNDMYPSGWYSRNWICSYCNIAQPPRSKHCHDCDKCVLQFDHHCVWLGTCIGQGNHCRFWWYIFEETILCIWTGILYISFVRANISSKTCYLVLTNQTTYELVRRRRIVYLRGVPSRVNPFSKGICRNVFDFCFPGANIYGMEPVPPIEDIEARSKPYTCIDIMSCRCC